MTVVTFPAVCEQSWRTGSRGWAKVSRDARILASTETALVGLAWDDIGADEVWNDDLDHVIRFGTPVKVRRMWHRRVWESTFVPDADAVFVIWTVLCEIPSDALESMSRWLSAGRLVLEALEDADQPLPAVPTANAAPSFPSAPALRVV